MFYPSATIRVMAEASRKISGMIMRDYYELQLLQNSRKPLEGFYNHLVNRAEQKLKDQLLKARPDFLIDDGSISEGDFWTFNVLEGKDNFLHALPDFTISIAHVRKKSTSEREVVSGLVVAPVLKEMYFAERGLGAWIELFDIQKNQADTLRISGRKERGDLLVATDSNIDLNMEVRNFGSAALSLVYLASGRVDAVVLKKYDNRDVDAGLLIASQAGAAVEIKDDTIIAATEFAKSQCNR